MLKNKFIATALVIIAVAALLSSGFVLGMRVGERTPKLVTIQGVANMDNKTSADFSTFWEAWSLVSDNYLKNKSVSDQTKVYGAIRGLVGSLGDPYTEFFNPDENKKFQADVRGNFSGIGAEIGMRKDQIVIIAPLKDSPAERAGVKAGDYILKVDSSSTDSMTVDDAVGHIRGEEGTNVTLNLFRDGWDKPRDFTITRQKIEVPTIDLKMKEGNIAHIQMYSFNANTEDLFLEALIDASKEGAQGIVLDLRNNPGGYLDVAVSLAGWFLPEGSVVVSEEGKDGERISLKSTGSGKLANFPLVILINEGSASASEILAGALRDNAKIKLIGKQSFGKGTVQELETLHDGSSIKMTIAHWVLPNGTILENEGLKPDYEVELSDEDVKNEKDTQLDKAIEVLKEVMDKQTQS
ncbi:MAG: S41 family peptidase [bacterium]|nr:S41 family peptidase [bacterium]